MRKHIAAFIAAAVVGILAGVNPAAAQTYFYAVKFICGTEAPNPTFDLPKELPVKPGNYATLINMDYLSSGEISDEGDYIIYVEYGASPVTKASGQFTLSPLTPVPVDCQQIVNILLAQKQTLPNKFIIGTMSFSFPKPAAVTAIYTTQGCSSFGSTGSTAPGSVVIPSTKPVCSGPMSIEVVPVSPIVEFPLTGGQ
jgi:hypothetical protein